MTPVRALFHIVDRTAWQAAAASGEYRPDSLSSEGFVHCSFAEQVAPVANARGVDTAVYIPGVGRNFSGGFSYSY